MSLMESLGAWICRWRGAHKWGRAVVDYKSAKPIQYAVYDAPIKTCQRCGATRPIKPRARKAKVEGGK